MLSTFADNQLFSELPCSTSQGPDLGGRLTAPVPQGLDVVLSFGSDEDSLGILLLYETSNEGMASSHGTLILTNSTSTWQVVAHLTEAYRQEMGSIISAP